MWLSHPLSLVGPSYVTGLVCGKVKNVKNRHLFISLARDESCRIAKLNLYVGWGRE